MNDTPLEPDEITFGLYRAVVNSGKTYQIVNLYAPSFEDALQAITSSQNVHLDQIVGVIVQGRY